MAGGHSEHANDAALDIVRAKYPQLFDLLINEGDKFPGKTLLANSRVRFDLVMCLMMRVAFQGHSCHVGLRKLKWVLEGKITQRYSINAINRLDCGTNHLEVCGGRHHSTA